MVISHNRYIPLFIGYTIVNFMLVLILFRGLGHSASLHQEESVEPSVDASPEVKAKEVPSEFILKGGLSIKIGVVDIQRVIDESKKGKEAKEYFEGLISLKSTDDLAKTEQELIDQIIQDIDIIIEEYAKGRGFTHIIDTLEGGVIYVDEEFNITNEIIGLYNKRVEISEDERSVVTNKEDDQVNIIDTQPPIIRITSPMNNTTTNIILVTGTIDDNTATVTVNGTDAVVADNRFNASGITLAEGANTITVTATDPTGNTATALLNIILDTMPPMVTILSPADGFFTNQTSLVVEGAVDDPQATITINETPAVISGDTYTATITLDEGANTVVAQATDIVGNIGQSQITATLDTTAPVVAITLPADGNTVETATTDVTGTIDDNTATVTVNGIYAVVADNTFNASGITLEEGANTITVTATDPTGNTATALTNIILDNVPPVVTISSPANGSVIGIIPITVTGTIDDNTATVTVNGIDALVDNNTFTASDINLTEGLSTITVTAADPAGNTATAMVSIILDTVPPVVAISSPADGFLTNQVSLIIEGAVDDSQATITVNGAPAVITGNTYTATIALDEGANTVVVQATDIVGNIGQSQITVTLEPPPLSKITSSTEN